MAWTLDDVTRLERAIASGQMSVRYEDMSVTYRSIDEMLRALDKLKRELGLTTGDSTRKYPSFRKGLL